MPNRVTIWGSSDMCLLIYLTYNDIENIHLSLDEDPEPYDSSSTHRT